MKKKKSEKRETKSTPKPENDDGKFNAVMKALLEVPKKSKGKKIIPLKEVCKESLKMIIDWSHGYS